MGNGLFCSCGHCHCSAAFYRSSEMVRKEIIGPGCEY